MRLSLVALLGLALFSVTPLSPAADAPKKIKVLLITGDDVTPAHNWLEIAQATKDTLLEAGKFAVDVYGTPGVLDNAKNLGGYDVVYMSMYNAKTPSLSEAAKENLLAFVKGGKGFVVTHLSSASFKDWPEFQKLCGRYWLMGKSGHGPRSTFKVKIVAKDNPITKGLDDFEADDELYAKLLGDDKINVLAEADSNWSKKTEPLVFTLDYGQGRVFHHTFGHDGKAVKNPSVQKIIQRGTEWAATGKVE